MMRTEMMVCASDVILGTDAVCNYSSASMQFLTLTDMRNGHCGDSPYLTIKEASQSV